MATTERRFVFLAALAATIITAFSLRLAYLSERPFHGDEANQAVRTGALLEKGEYAYDPHEHHGPTLYYLALIPLRLCGAHSLAESSESIFRLVPAVFGAGLLLLIWAVSGGLGTGAALLACLFTAISPAMVYYSRYFIQETPFVFFAFAAIAAGWRYWRRPSWWSAALTGAALGLMHATKETCVVLYFAMAASLAGSWLLNNLHPSHPVRSDETLPGPDRLLRPTLRWHLFLGVLVAAGVSVTLFSSFFAHPRGVLDSILAFTHYLGRAEGTGSAGLHDKPWPYYFQLLAFTYRSAGPKWSEGLLLGLGAVGILVSLLRRNSDSGDVHLQRFLALYTVITAAIFCAIPYKTPWNLLPFYQPWIIMAGLGASSVFRALRRWPLRAAAGLLLAVGVWNLGHQAYLANFVYPADDRNPYVYAHTSTAIRRLVRRVEDIADVHTDGHALQINIIQPDADYWPLPWYLRTYPNVGYWPSIPDLADAPLVLAPSNLYGAVKERLRGEYMEETHGLRPGVLRILFIRRDLWDAFMAKKNPSGQ